MSLFEGRDLACVRADRLVFQDLSFTLAAGEALVVTGPNGSGKSSFLRLLAGLGRPAEGALTWAGEPIAETPDGHRARLHYLGHQDAIKPVLSVTEQLATWGRLRRGGPAQVGAALERFGLTDLADLSCRLLSAGQRRRLALARLVATPAELWLLDEPSVGLDQAAQADLSAVIADHRAGGGRVVLATHEAIALEAPRQLSFADLPRPRPAELIW